MCNIPPFWYYESSTSVSSLETAWNFFPHLVVTLTVSLGLLVTVVLSIVNCSLPVRPSASADSPVLNCRGKIPIPTKLDLWMRSYDSAITALMPNRYGPFAAQSLELPDPYSCPASTISCWLSFWYFSEASNIAMTSPFGTYTVCGPGLPTNLFKILMLAKVPLLMISSFPLLAP